jgi:peroxiredoxin
MGSNATMATRSRPDSPGRPSLAHGLLVPLLLGLGLLGLLAGNGMLFTPVPLAGGQAPDFTLPTHDGRTFHLDSYRGRAVFLAFVPDLAQRASADEARALREAQPEFEMAGAKAVIVADASAEQATAFRARNALNFPVLRDISGQLARRYGIAPGERATFVIAPGGSVKFIVRGAQLDPTNHGQQLIGMGACCLEEVVAARSAGIGRTIADYSFQRADGTGMERLYNAEAHATVALFLSVKCPCSNAYNDRIRQIAARYAGRSVHFLGIYANTDESAPDTVTHARTRGFTFPIVHDENGLGADHFRASVTPQAFVMDSQHVLRFAGRIDNSRDPATVTHQELSDALDAVLAGRPVATPQTPSFGCAIARR